MCHCHVCRKLRDLEADRGGDCQLDIMSQVRGHPCRLEPFARYCFDSAPQHLGSIGRGRCNARQKRERNRETDAVRRKMLNGVESPAFEPNASRETRHPRPPSRSPEAEGRPAVTAGGGHRDQFIRPAGDRRAGIFDPALDGGNCPHRADQITVSAVKHWRLLYAGVFSDDA